MDKTEVLKQCTVEDNIVKLPDIKLDRKLYLEVAQALNLIGGKWKGGKVGGFVFENNPIELLQQIQKGIKRNVKKEYQFYATPEKIAYALVEFNELKENNTVLEPEAGQGAIVKAINNKYPNKIVDCFELMEVNRTILSRLPTANIIGNDFLTAKIKNKYDSIIANPPFSKNQDIEHIYKMWDCLKVGGRLTTVASNHWQKSNNKKETAFRQWLKDKYARIVYELKSGTFKESGTLINAVIITIDKGLK